MITGRTLVLMVAAIVATIPVAAAANDAAARARKFIADHEARVRPLDIAAGLAWWKANVTGRDEDFKAKEEAQNKLDAALSDAGRFAELRAIRENRPADPLLARQIDVLYLAYLEKQVDPELLRKMTAKANEIEQAFNVFRANVDGREMTDSEVRKVLKESRDSRQRRAVWEASKVVGGVVEKGLKELVALRNEAARRLGFKDYHVMQLHLNEQSPAEVLALFDQLDELTREPFRRAKEEIDRSLAQNSAVSVAQLRPWHYHDPFFQESPAIYSTDLDAVYANVDIVKLCERYYAGIGLPIGDVLSRSDLFEKPGKSPHAFCTDIDREGDVRVLANIVPNENWMSTMLHELGHAVYSSRNIPRRVPYVLRAEAHILASEGVAMLFERPSKSADWLQKMGVTVPDPKGFNEAGAKIQRNQLLIFSRWCQVMFRFEQELYARPEQDLNALWWDLVEKYQLVPRPAGRNAPDYASKIHVVVTPAYYHNYMLGQLFASQVHHAIAREVLRQPPGSALYVGRVAVGEFMQRKVFLPGRTMTWNELTKFATGEPLNPRAFAEDLRAQ